MLSLWVIAALLLGIAVLLWLCLERLRSLNVRAQDLVENTCTLIKQLHER